MRWSVVEFETISMTVMMTMRKEKEKEKENYSKSVFIFQILITWYGTNVILDVMTILLTILCSYHRLGLFSFRNENKVRKVLVIPLLSCLTKLIDHINLSNIVASNTNSNNINVVKAKCYCFHFSYSNMGCLCQVCLCCFR